jgi:hypothetical protein
LTPRPMAERKDTATSSSSECTCSCFTSLKVSLDEVGMLQCGSIIPWTYIRHLLIQRIASSTHINRT